MADVEMSSLTPPSHKFGDSRRHHLADAGPGLADDSMSDAADAAPRSHSSKASRSDAAAQNSPLASTSQHVRRKRSVLTRKGKRLAHLQSRDLVPSSRGFGSHQDDFVDDGDSVGTEGEDVDQDDDDDDDQGSRGSRQRGTPSRIRSITKYAVNYILPGAVSPLPHAQGGAASSAASGHPMDKPELLLGYAQLVFNASILSAFLYLLFHVVRTVQKDVAEKVRAYEMDTLSEITACAAAYTANRCGTDLQAPALAHACSNWERCSARDPAVVGTARVTAETFAEILNGFVDSVSWKTMFFTLICFSMVVGATNSFLSFFRIKSRSRSHSDNNSQPTQPPAAASRQPHTHAIAGAPPQAVGAHASGMPHYYHSPHPDFASLPPYTYANWQQLPPATPSRRRTRPAA